MSKSEPTIQKHMTYLPHAIESKATVNAATKKMVELGIRHLPVTEGGALIGVISDRDIKMAMSLLDAQPDWRADTGPAVVLGAGGAARAVIVSLMDSGATDIRLTNRSWAKAHDMAQEFGAPVRAIAWEDRHDALAGAALVVNTTNQGMHGEAALDLRLDQLPAQALVSDIIYVPLETSLLAVARLKGHVTVNGLGMLLNQARPAFAAWFGVQPGVTPALMAKVQATF